MVYLPADDYENYREDFNLSALMGTDGLTAVNLRPETVYVADGVTLIPVSAGRTAVSFTNALGYSLRRLSIRVTDTAVHSIPECGIAGHCTADDAARSKCRSCQKPLCNGEAHGVGVCEYEHLWVQKSYTAATATTVGHSVAECMTCGIVNERVFPATGG